MKQAHITLLFAILTFILFSLKPHIVNLIEPAPTVGNIISETAKDILDNLKSDENIDISETTKRQKWHNRLTLASFFFHLE